MVNGLHLYSAFTQSVSQYCPTFSPSFTDSFIYTSKLSEEEPGIGLAPFMFQPALPPQLLSLLQMYSTGIIYRCIIQV